MRNCTPTAGAMPVNDIRALTSSRGKLQWHRQGHALRYCAFAHVQRALYTIMTMSMNKQECTSMN